MWCGRRSLLVGLIVSAGVAAAAVFAYPTLLARFESIGRGHWATAWPDTLRGARPGSDGLVVEVYVVEVEVSDDYLLDVGEGVAEYLDQHP